MTNSNMSSVLFTSGYGYFILCGGRLLCGLHVGTQAALPSLPLHVYTRVCTHTASLCVFYVSVH